MRWTSLALAAILATGCESGGGREDTSLDVPIDADGTTDTLPADPVEDPVDEEAPWDPPPAAEDWTRDLTSTGLVIDLSALTGVATIGLAPSDSLAASFDVQGLVVSEVACAGGPLDFVVASGRLDVGVPADVTEIVVGYAFAEQTEMRGLMRIGATMLWPYYCGYLFPCHTEPVDGLTFSLELRNVPPAMTAVYPEIVPDEAPSYMLAWSVEEYTYRSLGTTAAGTEVGVWFLPGGEADALSGTSSLVAAFDWYERTLGPYIYGTMVGAVPVEWGPGAIGGMEHHPYWHVAATYMDDAPTHVHEAAHGWYGDGIRIRCWEDFVLSEGTVSYLAARATGQVSGPSAEAAIWADYEATLDWVIATSDGVAWPDSCGEVDILADGLFSAVPYMKGAFFYRAVADEVGADVLDGVLAGFYAAHAGEAAGMQDMLDFIRSETGFDPASLAADWLRSLGRP
jgi:hypothetical protein